MAEISSNSESDSSRYSDTLWNSSESCTRTESWYAVVPMATTRDFLLLHWKRLAVDFCLCVHVAVMSILRFDSLLQSLVCVKVPETAGPSYPCSLVGLGIIARVSSLIFRLPATIIAHTGAVLPYGTAPAPQELWTFVILCSSSLLMCVIISAPRFYILQARSYFWLVGNFLTSTAAFSSLIMCPDHPASIYHTKFLHIPGPFLILQQIVLQVCQILWSTCL